MRTRHLALLLVGTALWALLRTVLCYDEAPWQPVLYDYYHIDLGELSANQDQGYFGNSRTKIPAPMDAIVDVINDLGIKLLAVSIILFLQYTVYFMFSSSFSIFIRINEALKDEF